MKKIKLLMLLLIGAVVISSCKKTIDTTRVVKSKISFKVGGVQREGSGDENVLLAHYTSESTIQLLGNTGGTEGVTIMLGDFHGVGDYAISDRTMVMYFVNVEDPLENTYMANNGEGMVKITSFSNNRMKGEFQFTGKNNGNAVKVITEGTFEAKVTTL